jgi:hypothetical protein
MTSTFIKAAEVWVPSNDGSLLEFGAGVFGPACLAQRSASPPSADRCPLAAARVCPAAHGTRGNPSYCANSRTQSPSHRRGSRCWLHLRDRTAALHARCAQRGTRLLLRPRSAQASALELWHHDARITTDMTLVDGAYGPNAQPFESISHETYLPRGVGLPGLAWQRRGAVSGGSDRRPGPFSAASVARPRSQSRRSPRAWPQAGRRRLRVGWRRRRGRAPCTPAGELAARCRCRPHRRCFSAVAAPSVGTGDTRDDEV